MDVGAVHRVGEGWQEKGKIITFQRFPGFLGPM